MMQFKNWGGGRKTQHNSETRVDLDNRKVSSGLQKLNQPYLKLELRSKLLLEIFSKLSSSL